VRPYDDEPNVKVACAKHQRAQIFTWTLLQTILDQFSFQRLTQLTTLPNLGLAAAGQLGQCDFLALLNSCASIPLLKF
jgi:hypothetical protein